VSVPVFVTSIAFGSGIVDASCVQAGWLKSEAEEVGQQTMSVLA